MEGPIKILILEDNKSDADLLQRALNKSKLNYSAQIVETRESYENALDNFKPDIILADYQLPSFDGVTAFHIKQKKYPHLPFIIISGTIGEEKAVGLIKDGLTDYALKDKLFSVPDKIKRALREAEENRQKLLAEQKLIQSEKQLARAQQIAHLGNWEIDLATGAAIWSDETFRIFGLPATENKLTHDSWFSFIHPEDLDCVSKIIKEKYGTFDDYSFHYRIVRRDGTIRHIFSESKFEFDSTGKPVRLFGIVRDVTEIKEAEEMLRKSEENLRAIFDSTNTGFLLLDKYLKIRSFNKQVNLFAEKSFGYPLSENAGLVEMFNPEKQEEFRDMFTKILKKESINYETSYPQTDGKLIWYKVKGNPVLNRDGNVTGICLAVEDISARKQSEEKLEQQNKELQKTNTELDRFVYSTSHDLRAPLRSLLGLINIIKGGFEPGNKVQHERLEMMNKSIHKLDNFIQDILHYSHNSRMEVSKDEIQFEEMIQEIRNSHKFMEGAKGLNLQVEIHQKEKFVSDKRRVNVILNNLISNAIKYQDTSKANSFVNIFVECNHENAIIKIEDNGIGIAGKDQEKIFEMFYRATVLSSGSGLGMYIVKETVEKIGATIHLDSELGKGTTFTVRIPNLLTAIN